MTAFPTQPTTGDLQAQPPAPLTLTRDEWQPRAQRHAAHAAQLTAAHRARKSRHESHPIEDFLWTYYSFKPSELERWHPGAGVILEDADATQGTLKYMRVIPGTNHATLDTDAYITRRGPTLTYVETLLAATLRHTPNYGCFGLHEWAMVYHLTPEQVRHTRLPLRLGHQASDQVVRDHRIQCTHYDAYRFFTPDATDFNTLKPTRDTQTEFEQSACLHAGMDVYKWVSKLSPIMPGELLLDSFELARDIREVDMRASPYDVTGYRGADGELLLPIRIENAAGKREYAALQEGFAERGNDLRRRALDAIARAWSFSTRPGNHHETSRASSAISV